MINEAFWFFYWVDVAVLVAKTCGFTSVFLGVGSVFLLWAGFFDEEKVALYVGKRTAAITLVLILIAIFTPPKEAFYGGAGQYVAEAVEMDQTLINLKTLLDQKIEELGVPSE